MYDLCFMYLCEKLKTDGAIGEWRRLYNEEQHSLYSSLNIIRVIKSR
jgi:hypothetical protein